MPGLPTGSMPLISETAATAEVSTSTATMLGCSARKTCKGSRISAFTRVYMTSMRSDAEHLGVVTRVAEEVAAHLLEASHFREYLQVGIGDAELGGGGARHHLGRLADGIGDDVDGGHASRALSRRLVMHYFFAIWEKSATWAKTLAKRFKSFRRFARTSGSSSMTMVVSKNSSTRRAQGRQGHGGRRRQRSSARAAATLSPSAWTQPRPSAVSTAVSSAFL